MSGFAKGVFCLLSAGICAVISFCFACRDDWVGAVIFFLCVVVVAMFAVYSFAVSEVEDESDCDTEVIEQ